ncbi:hypothetical protein N431DRAFT_324199 [Stipitochalara longipes BDJ]|nr:hypothetical protein N431DRAFT_324199 [Stipitochalara longipes BDJ]
MAPKGPYMLCTVNKVPERAKLVVGRFIENVKENYIINHIGNAARIEDVKAMCEKNRPNVLFAASMWTQDESDEILRIAREVVPGIKTMAIPQGLQDQKGPDGVLEFLKERWTSLIE